MKIVVIGGTGLVGSRLVRQLSDAGQDAVAASPRTGVDAVSGAGLTDALRGAAVVVHAADAPSFDADAVLRFFETSTSNLLRVAAENGTRHVVLSVVGTDRVVGSHYLRGKAVQETLVTESGQPYTLLRATQFFEFARGIADSSTLDGIVRLPPALSQAIAVDDVATALRDASLSPAENRTIETAGPDQLPLPEFVRLGLAAAGDPRTVVNDPDATYFGAHLRDDDIVPIGPFRTGVQHYDAWLRGKERGR